MEITVLPKYNGLPRLDTLAPELLRIVINYLPSKDCLSLSLTCSNLYSMILKPGTYADGYPLSFRDDVFDQTKNAMVDTLGHPWQASRHAGTFQSKA